MLNIVEIRSGLDKMSAMKGFGSFPASAPDWVVRGVYEKSEGLPLSPLPAGIRVIKNSAEFRSFVEQKPARAKNTESNASADLDRLHRRYLNACL
jgi:hypothetical protein